MEPYSNWTFEEAWAAYLEEIRLNPMMTNDPSNLFSRWDGLQFLKELEKQFAAGEKFALMAALRVCARISVPMPDWVAENYILAHDTILNYRAKSWDDVFGASLPKGAHLNALRKKRMFMYAVYNEVIKRANDGKPVDEFLFEDVGRLFHIGKTLAGEYFYEAKKMFPDPEKT